MSEHDDTSRARLIDGNAVGARVRAGLTAEVAALRSGGLSPPGLGVILVGDDPASQSYVRSKGRACKEAGVYSETIRLPASSSQNEVIAQVDELNRDDRFHGILVQLPLPDHVDEDEVIRTILPSKDVDGLHPENAGLLLAGTPRFVPATPLGVQRLLIEEQVDTAGRKGRHMRAQQHRWVAARRFVPRAGSRRQLHRNRLSHRHARPRGRNATGGHSRGCRRQTGDDYRRDGEARRRCYRRWYIPC